MLIALDRDGVLNENRSDYVKSINELVFYEGVFERINECRQLGYEFVVISNQAGVAKRKVLEADLKNIDDEFNKNLIYPLEFFYCKHAVGARCLCRKPKPGLLQLAEDRFGRKIDVFVGDNITDYHASEAYGAEFKLVLTGHGYLFRENMLANNVKIYKNLVEYLDLLLSDGL
jgi:D-glycero-D-manno-heptose 1,7-bisphosphate phosphatase